MKDLVRFLRRIAVTVVGTVILAVGVVLLAAPGPGLLVILLALVVFAAEYEWARRHLTAVRARARSAADKAAASRVATASAILFGVGAVGLGGVLIFADVLPLSGAGTGAGVAVAGLTVLVTIAYSVRELRRAEKAGETEPAQHAGVATEPGRTGRRGVGGRGSARRSRLPAADMISHRPRDPALASASTPHW
ncbi:MAG: PGPGW domain-containing protein [Micromonosporaceae bacterium]